MTDYKEFLDIAVNQENKPVTYKLLARSLGIHVQNAKQALQEYSKSNNNLHVIYCIMGQSLNNDMSIQLVKEEDLEETKKKFKKITNMYIYSISSYSLDDLSMLYIANKDIPKLSLEDRVKCGILKYPVKYNKPAAKDLQPPPPPAKTNVPLSKQPVIATHSATKRKAIFPPDSSAAPSPLKKAAIEKTSKNTTTKATSSSKSKKNEKQVKTTPPKKTGSEEADLEKRMAKTSLKVEDIFSDDDQEEEPQQQEQQQQQQQDEEDIVMLEADEDNKEKAEEEHEDEEAIPAEPGKIRRKVLKKKTTTNARGLLVTEEVWEWETVDAPQEEVTKKTPKPTKSAKSAKSAPTANKPPATKKMGQSSLLSFFGKKP